MMNNGKGRDRGEEYGYWYDRPESLGGRDFMQHGSSDPRLREWTCSCRLRRSPPLRYARICQRWPLSSALERRLRRPCNDHRKDDDGTELEDGRQEPVGNRTDHAERHGLCFQVFHERDAGVRVRTASADHTPHLLPLTLRDFIYFR